jgi:non-lysosomal glucosylceramidase
MKKTNLKLGFFSTVILVFVLSGCKQTDQKPGAEMKHLSYTGENLKAICFPIGGIASGNITLGGRGNIAEMEIFNLPAKGKQPSMFNMLWVKQTDKAPILKIVEREIFPPYNNGFGLSQEQFPGFSRFKEVNFTGEYPFANLEFKDTDVPLKIELEAYNPFIPLDVDNSSIPEAIFNWKIENTSNKELEFAMAFNLKNPIRTRNAKGIEGTAENRNEYFEGKGIRGIKYSSARANKDSVDYGNISLATSDTDVQVQTHWFDGGWWDAYHILTDDISDDGNIKEVTDTFIKNDKQNDFTMFSTLLVRAKLKPGESKIIPVYLSWYFPIRRSKTGWEPGRKTVIYKNYYSTIFSSSIDAAEYTIAHKDYLHAATSKFHDLLFSSTFPPYVLDALSSQTSSLKTNLVIHDSENHFYGEEGLGDNEPCCFGTCTHVWNYEQTLAFLFPSLERSMRETAFKYDTWENGYQTFRTIFPPQNELWNFHPAADGQMGNIVRVYREWKISGDNAWLKTLWPKVKLALEFAWKGVGDVKGKYAWMKQQQALPWDANKDGVMEGVQHNTYDIEFYGPNTMTGALYLAALKASSEMASAMNEPDKAKEYLDVYKSGVNYCDKELWNGKYYFQKVNVVKGAKVPANLISPQTCLKNCICNNVDKKPGLEESDTIPKYQYGEGCLADQLLGQFLAHVSGLGYILDQKHVDSAMLSIFNNNFVHSFTSFNNVQRVYALNNEAGLLLCNWPDRDKRPALPFPYSDEVWTGIEYQVAASLIYSGHTNEGLQVVKATRGRYAGNNRNPWDEIECGHHYARAMSSWALLLSLSGFHYDGVNESIGFNPQISQDKFQTFWSCGSGWGSFSSNKGVCKIDVAFGSLSLKECKLPGNGFKKVMRNGTLIETEIKGNTIHFPKPIDLNKGDELVAE